MGHAWNHVELHCDYTVVEISTIVFLHCLLSIIWSFIGHGRRSKELPILVTVKSADFKFSDFLEEFLN